MPHSAAILILLPLRFTVLLKMLPDARKTDTKYPESGKTKQGTGKSLKRRVIYILKFLLYLTASKLFQTCRCIFPVWL